MGHNTTRFNFESIVRMKQILMFIEHTFCMLFIHGACACCPNGFSCVILCWLAIYWVPLLNNGLESLLFAIVIAIEATTKAKSLMSPLFLHVLIFACYVIRGLARFISSCKTEVLKHVL